MRSSRATWTTSRPSSLVRVLVLWSPSVFIGAVVSEAEWFWAEAGFTQPAQRQAQSANPATTCVRLRNILAILMLILTHAQITQVLLRTGLGGTVFGQPRGNQLPTS